MKLAARIALTSGLLFSGLGAQHALAVEENPVEEIENFKFYYSAGSEQIVEKMKQKDLVVVEPLTMQQSYIEEAQQSGTLMYGYISSMEVASWNQDLMGRLREEAYFHNQNGNRHHIAQWDSYLMDITNKHYQNVLLAEIEKQVVDKGLNGVFLDTVGDVEAYHSDRPEVMKEQQKGMEQFMQRVKQRFPELSIAQNWGFNTLENYTAEYVDFFLWENFSASNIEGSEWYANKIDQLNRVQAEHGIEVLTVSYEDKAASKSIAEKNGFKIIHHPAGTYYNQW